MFAGTDVSGWGWRFDTIGAPGKATVLAATGFSGWGWRSAIVECVYDAILCFWGFLARPFVGCFRGDGSEPFCSRTPFALPSSEFRATGGAGSSPVLLGLMYDISVDDDPRLGLSWGGIPAEISLCFDDDARLDGRGGGSVCGMEGSEARAFKVFVTASGLVLPPLGGGKSGDEVGTSTVRVLRNAIGLGETGPGAGLEVGLCDTAFCHLSSTELERGRGLSDGGGEAPNSFTLACSLLLV